MIYSKFKLTTSSLLISSALALASTNLLADELPSADNDSHTLVIWGESKKHEDTDTSSSKVVLTPEDLRSINATTTEDLVKHAPSLIIRKRFIGDANGVVGIRGSNMFQTSRSMVFADGVPLHYFLQTRWSGAPRWSLVSADEIAQIEVLYGPFSAEYSGNAMGGVVNIETAIPTERRVHLEAGFFSHDYSELGFNDTLTGNKQFISFEDKFDEVSVYFSYNRLENDGHPQTFRFSSATTPDDDATEVTGGILGVNEYGDEVVYYGNNGIAQVETNNYKVKLGYETDNWFTLFNAAYEDRGVDTTSAQSYINDANGNTIWNGSVSQNGVGFSLRERNFAGSELDRRSLLLGLRTQGELSNNWLLEASLSSFEVLEDQTRTSSANRLSPAHSLSGRVREYDNTGWQTANISFQNDQIFGHDNLSFVTGYNYESYQLIINNYDSDNYQAGELTELRNNGSSGGDTNINALYAQFNWDINEQWNTVIGGRYESWESNDGFFGEEQHIDRSESRFSPKYSLSYLPSEQWLVQLSIAKAYRFPIVEELFQNESRTNGTSLANANLEPEDGLHTNLMLQRNIEDGFVRVNYFSEQVDDVIFAQTTVIDNTAINTFVPIDTVDTNGVEFIYNQIGLADDLIDLRFNATYTDAKIDRNSANTSLEGNDFPRIPEWRANLTANFHLSDPLDIGFGIRYASNTFGDLDNSDTASNVFGAHDSFLFVDVKANYQLTETIRLSAGVDNVTNEVAFVHHPWPQRTYYVEASFDL